jgi:hypothetical protein
MPFAEPAQREEGGWCEEGSFQATCDLRAMRHHRCQQTCPKTSCKYHFSKIKCSKDISRNQGFLLNFFAWSKKYPDPDPGGKKHVNPGPNWDPEHFCGYRMFFPDPNFSNPVLWQNDAGFRIRIHIKDAKKLLLSSPNHGTRSATLTVSIMVAHSRGGGGREIFPFFFCFETIVQKIYLSSPIDYFVMSLSFF